MKEQVLALLMREEGSYLSGEAISQTLGVSRAAVWKAIEALRADGFAIEAATRRGYRLAGSPDRLSPGTILPLLRKDRADRLICFDSIDSTNTYAKKIALQGAPDGTMILADEQTGGRGRRGRSFYSPAGKGLYLSALYRPNTEPARAVNLTAFAAVAVCQAIGQVSSVKPGIKWPNDIVAGGKKLCGILTEMSIEAETGALDYVVAGMGINVSQQPEDFPPDVRDIATSLLEQSGETVSRPALAAALINELDAMMEAWLAGGRDYHSRYVRRCLNLGREVRLIRDGRETEAFAESVDEDFRLLVRYPDGTREAVNAGEVSVRGLFGYIR
ncbi:MAG: biotin--[Lachnospiraceae bacterium]|nr:biotin--[acetyl-CoA-carboxylase] ligase [Lachnospiraceae bacterium]